MIFDTDAIRLRVQDLAQDAQGAEFRAAVVALLRDANKAGRSAIAEAFELQPFAARELARSYTYLTDGLVTTALMAAVDVLHPIATPTTGERISVFAVGGYGRGEMAPFSDVDLLFLTPYKITAWAESVIESMLYILWDLRLKVGHSSRTIKDCIRLGSEDFTIRTA
ncbi:MAG: nucleotidyltransferase domain-containing protein, partial [Pseudomonadota bacterium]|nr:nucleotidyltransferase domain-containing protein [Pseudomonadota bacterium]